MTKVNKTKRLIAVISVLFVLVVGTFLLHGLSLRKSSRNKRTQIVNEEAIRVEDITASVGSQETNDESAEAVEKAPPQQLTDEDRSSNLELPSPFFEKELDIPISAFAIVKVWKNMDLIMKDWPRYTILRNGLFNEINEEYKDKNVDELTEIALQLRENFWKATDLSTAPYRDAYKARAIFENLHERYPGNLKITDELVESIQTTELLIKIDTYRKVPNHELLQTILEFRNQQFQSICDEIEKQGRKPTIDDFVRVCDLVYAQQYINKSNAIATLQWLKDNADAGGWGGYSDTLTRVEKSLRKGASTNFQIYTATALDTSFPKEYEYFRRTPSFRGPSDRDTILWGTISKEDKRFTVTSYNGNRIVIINNIDQEAEQ